MTAPKSIPNYDSGYVDEPQGLLDHQGAEYDDEPSTLRMVEGIGKDGLSAAEQKLPTGLDRVVWIGLFAGITTEDAIVEGLVLRGRWVALVAPAKVGKSTLALALALGIALGIDPLEGHARPALQVLYLDSEMGRVDLLDRLRDEMGMAPDQLGNLHYVDLVPRLNEIGGAAKVLAYVDAHEIDVVIVDGLNGAVTGSEKDDDTWRPLYDFFVSELKRRSVAVITCDNTGKDKTLGARGSSVKVDKPDAVIQLERTDAGIRLKTTHRRTAAYPQAIELAMTGGDGDGPVKYNPVASSWPAGTSAKATDLDRAGIALTASVRQAKTELREAGIQVGRTDVVASALRYRRAADYTSGDTSGNTQNGIDGEQAGEQA